MNFWGLLGTLRKFGNFVVGLFPVLGLVFDFFVGQLKKAVLHPAIKTRWDDFAKTKRGEALTKVFQRFFWRDYSSDRLELDKLPQDTVSSLRIIFIVSILLCLLIPLAIAGNLPEVNLELLSGEKGSAPIWSVALCMIGTAVAWGAVLAGASISNRPLLTALLVFYIYIFGTVAMFLPRSIYNLLLPVSAFLSIVLAEKSLSSPGKVDWSKGLIAALIGGVPAGIYILALTPLHTYNFGNVLGTGSIFGALLGFTAFYLGRRIANSEDEKPKSDVSKRVWMFSAFNLALLVSLLARGGWADFGSQLLSTISYFNSFLWPVWYFIGIGIIFKLLKHSKVFAKGVKDSLPSSIFTPLVVVLILAGMLLTWSESIVASFSLATNEFLINVLNPFYKIYRWSHSWLWTNPEWSQTAKIVKWVLGFELIAVLLLLIKRKLNAEYAASLFYFLVLSVFLVYEYSFQQFSLARSPSHSYLLLGFFAVWLLWLFHRVGLKMSLESTPLWPSAGRLPLYGGVLLFCLCEIHARCALEDYNIMNKIFLVMFRGIIDVGLPYFLYVFATRRFEKLPLKLSTIFSIFCIGALLTFPINVLDKFAMCNWSYPKFQELWQAQTELVRNIGIVSLPSYNLPTDWLLLKSLLFAGALIFITKYIDKTVDLKKPTAIIFATLAFASGFSSFTKTEVDLPIPVNWKILITPPILELNLNINVLAIYLSAWIPVLLFGFAIAWWKKRPSYAWMLATFVSVTSYFFLTYNWPSQEPFLRSTGLVYDFAIILSGLLIYLLVLSVRRIEAKDNQSKEESEEPKLLTNKQIHAIAIVFYLAMIYHANQLFEPAKMISTNLEVIGRSIEIPQRWGKNLQKDSSMPAIFNYKASNGYYSTIVIEQRTTPKGGNKELLTQLIVESKTSPVIDNLQVYNPTDLSKYYPGALGIYSNFELVTGKLKLAKMGYTALIPRTDSKTEIISLVADPEDFTKFEWDVIRMVQASTKAAEGHKPADIVELVKMQ